MSSPLDIRDPFEGEGATTESLEKHLLERFGTQPQPEREPLQVDVTGRAEAKEIPLSEELAIAWGTEERRVRAAARQAVEISPQKRAEALKISKDTGVPLGVVEQNLDRWRAMKEWHGIDFPRVHQHPELSDALLGDLAPVVIKDLSDPIHMADRMPFDEPRLPGTFLESVYSGYRRGVYNVELGYLGSKVMLGTASDQQRHRLDLIRTAPPVYMDAPGWMDDWGRNVAEMVPLIFNIGGRGVVGRGIGTVVGGVMGIPGGIPGIIAGGILGGNIGQMVGGTSAIFQIESGAAYAEFLGINDELRATLGYEIPEHVIVGLSVFTGSVNSALEFVGLQSVLKAPGMRRLLNSFNRAGARRFLTDRALRPRLARFGRQVLEAHAVEGTTEIAQEWSNVIATTVGLELLTDLEGPATEAISYPNLARAMDAGLKGATAGGGIAILASPFGLAWREATRARAAKRRAAGLTAEVGNALESDLRRADPEAYALVAQAAAEEKIGDPNLQIDAAELVTYFQSQGIDPADALAQMPEVLEQLDEAGAGGHDLVIPVGQYLAHLAEHHEGLNPHIRHRADALNLKEAQAVEADEPARIEREIRAMARILGEAEPSLAQIFSQDFLDRLLAAGTHRPEAAATNARILRAMLARRLQRTQGRARLAETDLDVQGPVREEPEVRRPRLPLFARLGQERIRQMIEQLRTGAQPELAGLAKRPMAQMMMREGGVDPSSPLAAELEAIGYARSGPGSLPGLYRRGGKQALDEFAFDTGEEILSGLEADEYGRVTDAALLTALEAEARGNPLRTLSELERINAAALPREELDAWLRAAGIDVMEATDEEIFEALENVRPADVLDVPARAAAAVGPEVVPEEGEPGTLYQHTLRPSALTQEVDETPTEGLAVARGFPKPEARKQEQIEILERLAEAHPNPLESEEAWARFYADLTGNPAIGLIPPAEAIRIANDVAALTEKLAQLTPGQRESAAAGLESSRQLGEDFRSGRLDEVDFGMVLVWAALSSRLTASVHEAGFLRAMHNGLRTFVEKAVRGEWTEQDTNEGLAWVEELYPEGSGLPVSAKANLRSVMTSTLPRFSDSTYNGQPLLPAILALANDPAVSTADVRRAFLLNAGSSGIQAKIFSFAMLVMGRQDTIVIDVWQARNLWYAPWMEGQTVTVRKRDKKGRMRTNVIPLAAALFDSIPVSEGPNGTRTEGLSDKLTGPAGIAIYEALERVLRPIAEEVYGPDGGVGRMHWETWLLVNDQEQGHASLDAIRAGTAEGARVREGRAKIKSVGDVFAIEGGQEVYYVPDGQGNYGRFGPEEYVALPKDQGERGVAAAARILADRGEGAPAPGIRDTAKLRRRAVTAARRGEAKAGLGEGRGARDVSESYRRGSRGVRSVGKARLRGYLWTPVARAARVFARANLALPRLVELEPSAANAKAFRAAVARGKRFNSYGAAVSLKDAAEYASMRMFLTEDGRAGFALNGDDIVSAFSYSLKGKKGAPVAQGLLEAAVLAGGRRLDCFDTVLPFVYSASGFRVTGRLAWSEEAKPDDWDKKVFRAFKEGEPDYLFMVWEPEHPDVYNEGEGPMFPGWAEGEAAQLEHRDALASLEAPQESRQVLEQRAPPEERADLQTLWQRAWHGSKALFGRFDLSFMGTGEGSQAFGWGLYFATRRGVAEFYREAVSGRRRSYFIRDGDQISDASDLFTEEEDFAATEPVFARLRERGEGGVFISQVHDHGLIWAFDALVGARGDADAAIAAVRAQHATDDIASRSSVEIAVSLIEQSRGQIEYVQEDRPGATYEVDLPGEENLLDWDVEFADQNDEVKAKLFAMAGVTESQAIAAYQRSEEMLRDALEPGATSEDRDAALDASRQLPAVLGAALAYRQPGMRPTTRVPGTLTGRPVTGKDIYYALARSMPREEGKNGEQVASEALAGAGIKGHRFLDAGSRAAGEGTHNFVIYDDAAIQIVQRLLQQEQGPPRGALEFDAELRRVTLRIFEAYDMSTVLHELGHLFFLFMQKDIRDGIADAEYQRDFQIALEFLGVESPDQLTPEHHETWARTWELYLREGKAPDVNLIPIFKRFQSWMVQIYRTVQALVRLGARPLNEEITGVFDRLLASEEQIMLARESRQIMPAFEDAESAGMTAAEYDEYRRVWAKAVAAAQNDLDRKLMKELERERTEEWKADWQRTQAEVERDINSRPVFNVIHWLQTGRLLNGEELPVPHVRMSGRALVEKYGPEIKKILPAGRKLWQAKGGMHPDAVADLFGFSSGDAMIDAIQAAGKRQEVIKQETAARMEEKWGNFLEDGTIAEEAHKAVESDDVATALVVDIRALAKRTGLAPTPAQLARATARRIIEGKRIGQLRPQIYRAAEARYGRDALVAIAERRWQDAHEARRRQLLQHYLAMEARLAKEKAEKQIAKLRTYLEAKTRQRIGRAGQDYLDQIDRLLSLYEMSRMSDKKAAEIVRLSKWIEDIESSDMQGTVIISEELQQKASVTPIRMASVDEIQDLYEAVENIAHLANLKRKLLTSQQKREFEAELGQVVGTIYDNHKLRKTPIDIDTKLTMWERFTSFLAAHRKIEFLIEMLDGGVERGPIWQRLYRPVVESRAIENQMVKEMAERFQGIFRDLKAADAASAKLDKVYVPEVGRSFTREQLFMIAMNVGNSYNREALQSGGQRAVGKGWSDADLDAILAHLTKAEWDAAQAVWDLFESYKPQMAAMQRRLTGVEPRWVEREQVTTPFGVYAGGYMPLKADPNVVSGKKAERRLEALQAKDLYQNQWARAQTKQGHLKERKGWGDQTVLLSFDVITEHLHNVIHDIAFRETLIDVGRLTSHEDFVQAMRSTVGRVPERLFRPWLQFIASDIDVNSTVVDPVLRHLRAGTTVAYMGLKLTTIVAQLAGVFPAIERVGLVPFINASIHFYNPLNRDATMKMVMEKSKVLPFRMRNFDRDARDALRLGMLNNRSVVPERLREAHKSFLLFTGMADMSVSIPTWLAAYESAIAEGQSEADAVAAGDQAIRMTQGTGTPEDLAAIQRGPELLRMFTMFYSYFNVFWNQMVNTTSKAIRGDISLPAAAASACWIWFMPALVSELLAYRGPDREDEEWPQWMARNLIKYPFLGLVGPRDIVNLVENKALGRPFGFQPAPALAAFEPTVNAFWYAYEDVLEGELRRKTVRSWFDTAGYWGRLPSRQMWITLEAVWDQMTGQGEIESPLDFVFSRPIERRAR